MNKLLVLVLITSVVHGSAGFKEFARLPHPELQAFQELLQEKYADCEAEGKYISFRDKYSKSVVCDEDQVRAMYRLSKWHKS